MELLDELESAVKRGDAETAYKLAIRGERPQQERRFAELKGKVRNIRAYRCAFIHVPKAGGTSLQKVVQDIGGFSIGHRAISDAYQLPPVDYYNFEAAPFIADNVLSDVPTVVSVRNLYAWLASYYFDAKRIMFANIDDSIAAHRYDFADFVRYLSDKDYGWPCRRVIFFPAFKQPSGTLAVDWVVRIESAQDDMGDFAEHIGAKLHQSVLHANKNTKGDYRRAYSDATIELVQKTWADDIKLFGFGFDTLYTDGAILHRETAQARLDKVRYSVHQTET